MEHKINLILTNSFKTNAFDDINKFKIHHFPMIKIKGNNIKPFNLSDYDYYVFTSQNSVELFFDYPFVRVQYEENIKAICAGLKTEKKLRHYGVSIAFCSSSAYSHDMINELADKDFIKESKIALVVGDLVDYSKFEKLKKFAFIDKLEVYQTIKKTQYDKDLDLLLNKGNSITVFASPSSFDAFSKIYDSSITEIYSIGETTSNHIKSKGFKVSTSKKQNFEALANQISNNYII